MKKFLMALLLVMVVSGCTAGQFEEKRNRLHNMGREGICEQDASRCVDGVPW